MLQAKIVEYSAKRKACSFSYSMNQVGAARSPDCVLLVEQKPQIALRILQRIYRMGHGRIVCECSRHELPARADVRHDWLEV